MSRYTAVMNVKPDAAVNIDPLGRNFSARAVNRIEYLLFHNIQSRLNRSKKSSSLNVHKETKPKRELRSTVYRIYKMDNLNFQFFNFSIFTTRKRIKYHCMGKSRTFLTIYPGLIFFQILKNVQRYLTPPKYLVTGSETRASFKTLQLNAKKNCSQGWWEVRGMLISRPRFHDNVTRHLAMAWYLCMPNWQLVVVVKVVSTTWLQEYKYRPANAQLLSYRHLMFLIREHLRIEYKAHQHNLHVLVHTHTHTA